VQDLSCLQSWLVKYGHQLEVLWLHVCRDPAVLTALPCLQLQDLLLSSAGSWDSLSLDSRVWSDIAAATKLTSVSLDMVQTASQQADVVSALTTLPDLEQLTWSSFRCGPEWGLSNSKLLHKLTKLTALKLDHVRAAEALEHLGLLTRLQDLSLHVTGNWPAAGCPGLQELKALTRLELRVPIDIPPSVSQLTALHQLEVLRATPTALNKLSALTGLTRLCVAYLVDLLPVTPPLQLPGLQHLEVDDLLEEDGAMPTSFLSCCTQLRVLKLSRSELSGPGSLVASSMLQHLELHDCRLSAADDWAAEPVAWQDMFPGQGQLPHLTSLQLMTWDPYVQHADMECVVSCCSSLQVLQLQRLPDSVTSALSRLPGLTSLVLAEAKDQQCSSLAQLTGLRDLRVEYAYQVSAAGLRQLAALEQLTSLGLHHLGWSSPRLVNYDVLREHMSDRLVVLPGHCAYKHAIRNQVCVCLGEGALLSGISYWHPTCCCRGLQGRPWPH